jgi:predicted alpha/beta hydrolase family esterase
MSKSETSPIPLLKLDYPSLVITSSNDPYISVERAEFLAEKMGENTFINNIERPSIPGQKRDTS